MKTTDFDRIASSAPLDATASAVRDGSGDIWTPMKQFSDRWEICPPTRAVDNPELPDFAGRQFGRLKVVGLIDEPRRVTANGKDKKSRWAVRCSCGWFEPRSTACLRKYATGTIQRKRPIQEYSCQECDYVQWLGIQSRNPRTMQQRRDEETGLDALAAKHRSAA